MEASARWVSGKTAFVVLAGVIAGCAGDAGGLDPSAIPEVEGQLDPGREVVVSALALTAANQLENQVAAVRELSAEELASQRSVSFESELGYDPNTAQNLDVILGSFYAPGQEPSEALAQHGFFIDRSAHYPSFAYGYSDIYAADLPVFISADMVLEALYRSHDKILQALERQVLRPTLERMLVSTRTRLLEEADTLPPETASDLNVYLGVALSLLDGGHLDRREPKAVDSLVQAALAAAGEDVHTLFGVERRMDFSQFKPRGHYAGDAELESYFRAMIWLGRIDMRLMDTQTDGRQVFRRRQVDSMLTLRRLVDGDAYAEYLALDRAIGAFVGEHDYMTLQQVDELLEQVGGSEQLSDLTDDTLAGALVDGHFGQQRIASHVMRRNPGPTTFPLNVSFALLGQRYTVDSHVFSNVVYDRLPSRVVPNPLDVAFGALGNDQALTLLGDELANEPGFAGGLAGVRLLVDEHPPEYWQSSLYTGWMNALRTLSPKPEPDGDLPSVAQTEAWGRRLLNTQLASWAQLRHNNVLYVKQSYTSSAACEYPDAYVDPYPDFFHAVVQFAESAEQLTDQLELSGALGDEVRAYFEQVSQVSTILAEMAEYQRSGNPHSAEHLAFINRAVTTDINCDGTVLGHRGWYADLHFDALSAVKAEPIITDVHTDIGGELPVARDPSVLHVGTGLPRLMVVTVDSCDGPRAYAGVVSAYHELLQDGLERWTDDAWKDRLNAGGAADVEWMDSVLVGQ